MLYRISGFIRRKHESAGIVDSPTIPFLVDLTGDSQNNAVHARIIGVNIVDPENNRRIDSEIKAEPYGLLTTIDAEITVDQLVKLWKEGKKTDVLKALEKDHAGLTAMFIVAGTQNHGLTFTDCNEVTNMLTDLRQIRCADIDTSNMSWTEKEKMRLN